MFGLHQGVYSPSLFFNSMLQLIENMWINGYEVPLSHKLCLSKNYRTGPRRLKSRSISHHVLARRKKEMELHALDEKTWETQHVAPPHTPYFTLQNPFIYLHSTRWRFEANSALFSQGPALNKSDSLPTNSLLSICFRAMSGKGPLSTTSEASHQVLAYFICSLSRCKSRFLQPLYQVQSIS